MVPIMSSRSTTTIKTQAHSASASWCVVAPTFIQGREGNLYASLDSKPMLEEAP